MVSTPIYIEKWGQLYFFSEKWGKSLQDKKQASMIKFIKR